MSLCTVCGRLYCDHSAAERGQTVEEMMRPLSQYERDVWHEGDTKRQIEVAKEHAHDPV